MLGRLESRGRPLHVPYVAQNTAQDCGPACLASVLRFHGIDVRLEQVRELCAAGRDGTSALLLVQAAERLGLRGRGVQLDVDAVRRLPVGTILHWKFHHFVVFERMRGEQVEIVDPAAGRRRVPMDEFRKQFTGVALLFEKSESFVPTEHRRPSLWLYARRYLAHRPLLVRIMVVSALLQVFGLGLPVLTGILVDRVIPRNDVELLQVVSIGLLLVFAFQVLTSLLRGQLILHLRTQVDAQTTLDFLDHLVGLPYAFFQRRPAGDLMMRMNSNQTVREILTSSALSGALDGTMVFSYLVVIALLQPLIGGLVAVLALLRISVFLLTRRRIRELMAENLSAQAVSQSYQVQMLAGIETLKASGSESRAVQNWSGLFVDVLNVSLARGRLGATVQAILDGLAFVSPIVVLLAGGLMVMNDQLSLGAMLAICALAGGFLTPLGSLMGTLLQLQEVGSYVDRLDDVLGTEREQDRTRVRSAPSLRGRVTLESVTFRYSPMVPPAVHDVSLDVAPGSMIAVVGRSAAGKSTLASLLMALYRPESGRILYDGIPLASLDVRTVRRQIGVVTQFPFLFGASVRENVAYADPSRALEDVQRAARLAQIHDEIVQMPMGYDTLLVDGGQSLSGGQRQRIALARALVGRPVILVLDEATSALDADNETRIHRAIADLECTRIVIAHRLSTIRSADQILVMEAGSIVERGRHEDLIARTGPYRELLEGQLTTA